MEQSLRQNGSSAAGRQDGQVTASVHELRVWNAVLIALALSVLTVTGLYCISVCYTRLRQAKRARVYESAVSRGQPDDLVAVKAVRRSTSFINPLAFFRKAEAAKNNSRIYYIYSNPLPVGLKEDEEEERQKSGGQRPREARAAMSMPPLLQDCTDDPKRGLFLEPPIFYLQL